MLRQLPEAVYQLEHLVMPFDRHTPDGTILNQTSILEVNTKILVKNQYNGPCC